jgi:hypothetical protein
MSFVGFFNMPLICDMGQMALLPFWRKVCWGFFSPWKIRWLRPGLNPRTWVPEAITLTTRPPKLLSAAPGLLSFLHQCCHKHKPPGTRYYEAGWAVPKHFKGSTVPQNVGQWTSTDVASHSKLECSWKCVFCVTKKLFFKYSSGIHEIQAAKH